MTAGEGSYHLDRRAESTGATALGERGREEAGLGGEWEVEPARVRRGEVSWNVVDVLAGEKAVVWV